MKGLMVALLTLLIAGSAFGQDNAQGEPEGWFVLKLDKEELKVLLSNPNGLIAELPKDVRDNVTHVVVKLKDFKPSSDNQAHTTGRQDFQVASAQAPSLDPNTGAQPIGTSTNPINNDSGFGGGQFSGANRQFPNNTERSRLDNSTLNPRLSGNSNGSSTLLPRQQPFNTANQNTTPSNQSWIPFGDNTDFMPVTRPNWVNRDTGLVAQDTTNPRSNDFLNRSRPNQTPTTDTGMSNRQIGNWRDRDSVVNNNPRTNNPLNTDFNRPLNRSDLAFDSNPIGGQFSNRRQPAETQMPQTNDQQRQTQALIERQMAMMEQQQRKIEELEQRLQLQNRPNQLANHSTIDQRNAARTFNGQSNQFNRDPLNRAPIANPSNRLPNRYANDMVSNQSINDPREVFTSAPNRRIARNDASPRLPVMQIPANKDQDSTPDASQVANQDATGGSPELLAQQKEANQTLRKSNTFLLFMLLCSIGLNAYLGLIARSFYMRYAELADELRETFTATM